MKTLAAVLFACVVCAGCVRVSTSVSTAAVSDDEPFAEAVAAARAGDDDRALAALEVALASDASAVERALLHAAFADGLRDTSAFRRALHDASVAHGVSSLSIAPPDEPGERVEVTFRVVDGERRPVPDAVIHVYGTDVDGLYHPTIDGDGTPRLFGTLVTDADGTARVDTVRPGPYPDTRDAIHFHIGVDADGRRLTAPRYIVFDDDPLLFEPGNEEQRGEALRIAMSPDGRTGTIDLPVR